MKYLVSYKDADRHFIDFKLIVDAKDFQRLTYNFLLGDLEDMNLGNFAKNIKDFNILDTILKK